jgi:hypothetical protein
MMDVCAGGALSNLTLNDCEDLFAKRAFSDKQYNPTTNTKQANGILSVPQYLISEVAKSMEEKGIPAEKLFFPLESPILRRFHSFELVNLHIGTFLTRSMFYFQKSMDKFLALVS